MCRPAAPRGSVSHKAIAGDFISVDGKNLRRALTRDGKMPCIVSAHLSRTKLVISQVKADE